MAVHVCLQGRRTRKTFVAHLAFMLFLRVRWHLRAELAHHRLGSGWSASSHETSGSWQGSRWQLVERFRGRGAVVGNRRVDRCDRRAVVRVIARRGDGRNRRVGGRKTVRLGRTPRGTRRIDISRRQILAQSNHSATGVNGVPICGRLLGRGLSDTRFAPMKPRSAPKIES